MNNKDIIVVYGSDARTMTRTLIENIPLEDMVNHDAHIVLKPNLVVPRPASEGATTHPEIVQTLIEILQERGFFNLSIVESAWVGASTKEAFRVHKYDEIAKHYNVNLIDVKHDSYQSISAHGYSVEMSQSIMKTDFLISLPVLKGHCQTMVTCALKNMKGCISDASKRKFHAWGLHEPIAALNTIRSADLVIVDSLEGDLDFEEGGNPVQTNRMFAGIDSVLIDTFGANLMGFDASEIPYIQIAEQFGIGSTHLDEANIFELNADTNAGSERPSGKVKELATHTIPSSACSACYGNLIHAIARMQDHGTLHQLRRKVHIGQGYKGKSGCGIGVGICTSGFTHSLPGCPPRALDMVHFLERLCILE